ncbi:MAG: hypothetical protein MAG431_01570 [Chloroflexi bacterium]|nr:hypothetical protein [Chloroflexota bacterium]
MKKLRDNKFKIHLAVFLTGMAASPGLYFAAQNERSGVMWGLIITVALGNLLAVFV